MVAQLENKSVNSTVSLSHTIKGLVQVFTSSYRSFFTNVMAQALRIAGQGTPVLIVQFLKGGIHQGKDNPMVLGQNLDWIRCDLPRCIDTPHLDDMETEALHSLWHHTLSVVNEGKYSLVVLDELSLAINFGLIPETEVIEFLAKRPQSVDIILTGAEMPKSILDLADEVTEVRRPHRL
ncbi:MAG: P-loop NTPase family protein [Cyanobacteria bacterium P01_D01_bin.50]